MGDFISGLAKNGLKDLATTVLDGLVNKGLESTQSTIKDVTGLDIDFKKQK